MKCLALLILLVLAAPAHAADTKIAPGNGVSNLSAFGGHVVWSKRSGKRWSLYHWHAGKTTKLPVPSRAVPFDADIGPDADGHPTVVYSTCTKDPAQIDRWTNATGCTLQRLRLDTAALPTAIAGTPGTSATNPSIWRDRIAFVRHTDGDVVSSIVLDAAGTERPLAGPRVPCDLDCDDIQIEDNIQSLDLGPKAVAFSVRFEDSVIDGVGYNWQLLVDELPSGHQSYVDEGFIDGACGYVEPFDVTARGSGVAWDAAGSPCDATVTDFARFDVPTRRKQQAKVKGGVIAGASFDGSTVYWLRARDLSEEEVLVHGACAEHGVTCEVIRSTGLRYSRLGRDDPFGPYPEDE